MSILRSDAPQSNTPPATNVPAIGIYQPSSLSASSAAGRQATSRQSEPRRNGRERAANREQMSLTPSQVTTAVDTRLPTSPFPVETSAAPGASSASRGGRRGRGGGGRGGPGRGGGHAQGGHGHPSQTSAIVADSISMQAAEPPAPPQREPGSARGQGRGRGRARRGRGAATAPGQAASRADAPVASDAAPAHSTIDVPRSSPETAPESPAVRGSGRRGRGGRGVGRAALVDAALPVPAEIQSNAVLEGSAAAAAPVESERRRVPRANRPLPSSLGDTSTMSQAEIMTAELRAGSYECSICFDAVRARDAVWACDTCYRVLHLTCAKQWRDSSSTVAPTGSDEGRAAAGTASWRCPGCRAEQTAAPTDRCFCGKTRKPDVQPYLAPHSCGEVCGKARGAGCPHRCESVCHAGACAPCSAMGPQRHCGCGKSAFRLRCGASEREVASRTSCGQPCGRALGCGVKTHRCARTCHTGPCGPCQQPTTQSCYCGRSRSSRTCGTGHRQTTSSLLRLRDTCAIGPCVEAVFEVGRTAAKGSSAGEEHQHEGGSPLEKGSQEKLQVRVAVPLQPSLYMNVEGQGEDGNLLALLASAIGSPVLEADLQRDARQLCKAPPDTLERQQKKGEHGISSDVCDTETHSLYDPAPMASVPMAGSSVPTVGFFSCASTCGAWLACGLHRCQQSCHGGDCAPCQRLPTKVTRCACGKSAVRDMEAVGMFGLRLSCLDPLPTCGEVCDRIRPCGHACIALCHEGPCPPCHAAVEKVECRCGCTVVEAPVESKAQGGAVWEQGEDEDDTYRRRGAKRAASTDTGRQVPILTCYALYALAANGGDLQAWHKARQTAGMAAKRGDWGEFEEALATCTRLTTPSEDAPWPVDDLRTYPLEVVSALLRCKRTCSRPLRCGRHACSRACCPIYRAPDAKNNPDAAAEAQGRAESLDLLVMQLAERLSVARDLQVSSPPPPAGYHACPRECGRTLACGKHACQDVCHAGACGPCGAVDMRPLSCTCGRIRVEPPVRCGTVLPKCTAPCSLRTACGHGSSHPCHAGPCPPCMVLTNRLCAGGHEKRVGIPCHIAEVVCARQCGKPLPCGDHACARPCHPGPCVSQEILQQQAQLKDKHASGRAGYVRSVLDKIGELLSVMKLSNGVLPFEITSASERDPATLLALAALETKEHMDQAAVIEAAQQQYNRIAEENSVLAVSCGQLCRQKRSLCDHACSAPCHPGRPCPSVPCQEEARVLCSCGRLMVKVKCLHGGSSALSEEELDLSARCVPCDPLCTSMGRARALGRALGLVEGPDAASSTLVTTKAANKAINPYPESLLSYARDNPVLADKLEKLLRTLVLGIQADSGPVRGTSVSMGSMQGRVQGDSVDTQPLPKPGRAFMHTLAELWGCTSASYDPEGKRYVRVTRGQGTRSSAAGASTDGAVTRMTTIVPSTPTPSGTDLSSIGRPVSYGGPIVVPSLTLVQAVEELKRAKAAAAAGSSAGPSTGTFTASASNKAGFAAFRLGETGQSAGRRAFASSEGSALTVAASASIGSGSYPGEPSVDAMDPSLIGCVIFVGGIRRSTKESAIKAFLAAYGGDALLNGRVQRLDDHALTITFSTQGLAERALSAARAGQAKGGADSMGLPGMRIRYWGVGVAGVLVRQSEAAQRSTGDSAWQEGGEEGSEADEWQQAAGSGRGRGKGTPKPNSGTAAPAGRDAWELPAASSGDEAGQDRIDRQQPEESAGGGDEPSKQDLSRPAHASITAGAWDEEDA